ncbi:MAG: carboxypeptidase regulatory-like domain-containing protein [Prolixibacteraceae bacterium]|nr:carboxypeptidase regulatory-like domain-containing protein [Prolixibacteraceae bacterium]
MKTLIILAFLTINCFFVFAQNDGPTKKISQQVTDYFNVFPKEKIFLTTDKQCYKPGETIWFNATVTDVKTQLLSTESQDFIVKLYNKNGGQVAFQLLQLTNGSASGDLEIPDDLTRGQYFLVAYTLSQINPEEVFCAPINVDPAYSDQWIVSAVARDSISVSGQKNELAVMIRNLAGASVKNASLRYQLMNGTEIIGKGKLKTDDSGNTVVTFTLPAKSNGEPFICELTDNKNEWKKEIFLPSNLDPLKISFFPEGGTILTGVPVKIGFTAFNNWGMPVDLEGSVVNQEGKQVAIVKTFTEGLGMFAVENDGKQKLKLVISGKTGQNQTFDLPAPNTSGLAFSIAKTDAEFISANLIFADKQKHAVTITSTNGGGLNWAADMDINGLGRIKIPTEFLPQGINLLSVFADDTKLPATRLVYVDKKQHLKVEVLPEKSSLKQGESMKIKIRLTDENNQPASGNVSVSVADKFRKTPAALKIEEYHLAGPELETPFSLISAAFQEQITNTAMMDVFLIANRQGNFDWQKIMQFKPGDTSDNIQENKGISGIVTDKNGNKINKAKVSLVNNKNMQLHTTTTNQDGMFSFPNLDQSNKEDFTAKATDPEGKRELNIDFIKNFEEGISEYVSGLGRISSLLYNDMGIDASYFRNNPDLFNKAPKIVNPSTVASDNQKKLLSTSTNILDVIKTIKPYKLTNNQIVFYGSENSLNYQGGALIVIDGQQIGTDVSAITSISPTEVERINVSTNPMDIQRYTGLNSVGIVEIFMKRGPQLSTPETEKNTSRDKDDMGSKVFQSEPSNVRRDFRTTLQWIPELIIDETGEAEISVTAGKVISDFVIEVQGMSTNGRIGSGNEKFQVVKQ